ncbi:MAG: M23 family metallopeptidase [Desulfobacterales bacterium]|nr:M23 family metallopeptidase [Desulfobacterales bacterium]
MKHLYFNPVLSRVLILLLMICVGAVPFLESGLLSLADRVYNLEKTKLNLQAEVRELRFLKETLVQMEEKDKVLRAHFGMEALDSLPMMAFGGGGLNHPLVRGALSANETAGKGLGQRLKRVGDNAQVLGRLQMEQDLAWHHTPSILPVSGGRFRITSAFGWRQNPFTERREFHSGIDIMGSLGTRIIAPASGVVVRNGYDDWLGNYLVIQHTSTIKTIYGHLEKASVSEGARVERGQRIGFMGNTGMSTSRHLHYTVISGIRAVDPMQYVLDANG